jgi:hypothetical protein
MEFQRQKLHRKHYFNKESNRLLLKKNIYFLISNDFAIINRFQVYLYKCLLKMKKFIQVNMKIKSSSIG